MQTTVLTPSTVRLARITAAPPMPEGADIQKAIYGGSREGRLGFALSLLLLGLIGYNIYASRRGNRT